MSLRKSYHIINKGWGYEKIIESNELYCAKILHFNSNKSCFSMHFHADKDETWYVLSGKFALIVINTITAEQETYVLEKGESFRVRPLVPHRLIALEDNSEIFEVSTEDKRTDNYRISPGDSQNS